ncbi:MAG: DUF3791 domain-containing protein [Bacilli bacterium]|nr:DUF3791 domain-containing protein [Bacilli bacterium]
MDEKLIGQEIKQHRLALNLSMDYVAHKANITRATLWSIEKGKSNSSFSTYLRLMKLLGLSLELRQSSTLNARFRATRRITALDKKINEFIIMCVELYASYKNKNASEIYRLFKKNGLINLLNSDYEDMHGMSVNSLNEYFDVSLKKEL